MQEKSDIEIIKEHWNGKESFPAALEYADDIQPKIEAGTHSVLSSIQSMIYRAFICGQMEGRKEYRNCLNCGSYYFSMGELKCRLKKKNRKMCEEWTEIGIDNKQS